MNRIFILALTASAAVTVSFVGSLGGVNPPVDLQPASPGAQQVGNANISGRILAGSVSATNAGPAAQVVVGNATSTSGANFGGLFRTSSDTGTGVRGVASSSTGSATGGTFQSAGSTGAGVRGNAIASTGTNFGVYGQSDSTSGRGVFGLATADSGFAYGVLGQSDSTTGRGVRGFASASSGRTVGVSGMSYSTSGHGVSGWTSAQSGYTSGVFGVSYSSSGRGVYGLAESSSGTTYGVWGQAWIPNGFGVFSQGDLSATGTKAFRIDHPLDPENRYLLHYAAESPQPQNFYLGNVVTDSKGFAWVTLPDYFQEINTNFKYQLTVISESSDFVQAMVSKKIQGVRFQIRTSAPNTEVSWRVDADRNDLYCQKKRPKDVVEKVGVERGTYQHPELYGLGIERGIHYDPAIGSEGAIPSATLPKNNKR